MSFRSPHSRSSAGFRGDRHMEGTEQDVSTESESGGLANVSQFSSGRSHASRRRDDSRSGRISAHNSSAPSSPSAFGVGRLPIVGRIEWAVETHRAQWWSSWKEEADTSMSSAGSISGASRKSGRRSLHLKRDGYEPASTASSRGTLASKLLRKNAAAGGPGWPARSLAHQEEEQLDQQPEQQDRGITQTEQPSQSTFKPADASYAASLASQPRSAASTTQSFEQSTNDSEEQMARGSSIADTFSEESFSMREIASRATEGANANEWPSNIESANLESGAEGERENAGYAALIESDDNEAKAIGPSASAPGGANTWQSFEDVPDTDEGMWQQLQSQRPINNEFPEEAAYVEAARNMPLMAVDLAPPMEEDGSQRSAAKGLDEELETEDALPRQDDFKDVLSLWATQNTNGEARQSLPPPPSEDDGLKPSNAPTGTSLGEGPAALRSPIALSEETFGGPKAQFVSLLSKPNEQDDNAIARTSLQPPSSPSMRSSTSSTGDLSDSLSDMERALELLSPSPGNTPNFGDQQRRVRARMSTGSKRASAGGKKEIKLRPRAGSLGPKSPGRLAPATTSPVPDTPQASRFALDQISSPRSIPPPHPEAVSPVPSVPEIPVVESAPITTAAQAEETQVQPNDSPETVIAEVPSVEPEEEALQQQVAATPEASTARKEVEDPQIFSSPEHDPSMPPYNPDYYITEPSFEHVQAQAQEKDWPEVQAQEKSLPPPPSHDYVEPEQHLERPMTASTSLSSDGQSQGMSDLLADYQQISSQAGHSDSSGAWHEMQINPLAGESDPFAAVGMEEATPLARTRVLSEERPAPQAPAPLSHSAEAVPGPANNVVDDGFETTFTQARDLDDGTSLAPSAVSTGILPSVARMIKASSFISSTDGLSPLARSPNPGAVSPTFSVGSLTSGSPPEGTQQGRVQPLHPQPYFHTDAPQARVQPSQPQSYFQQTEEPEPYAGRSSEEWSQDGSLEEDGGSPAHLEVKDSEFDMVPGTPTFLYEQHLHDSRPQSLASNALSTRPSGSKNSDAGLSSSPQSRNSTTKLPSPLRETNEVAGAAARVPSSSSAGLSTEGLGLESGPRQRLYSQDGSSSVHSSEDFDGRLDDMLNFAARLPPHPGMPPDVSDDQTLDVEQMTLSTREAVRQALSESLQRTSLESSRSMGYVARSPTSPVAMEAWPRRASGGSIPVGPGPQTRQRSIDRIGSPLSGSGRVPSPSRRFGELPPSPSLAGINTAVGVPPISPPFAAAAAAGAAGGAAMGPMDERGRRGSQPMSPLSIAFTANWPLPNPTRSSPSESTSPQAVATGGSPASSSSASRTLPSSTRAP